jgi:hemerythrin superfamily protein
MAAQRKSKSGSGRGGRRETGGFLRAVKGAVQSGLERIVSALPPADDSLDAMDLLKAQHRYVDKLFADIENADGAPKTRAFRELADMLAIHATIEERVFYPGVKTASTEELLREAAEEHLAMKRVLADLLELSTDGDEFDAKLSVLKEEVHHHALEEEEGKLFPKLRAEMDPDYMAALAGEMIALMVGLQWKGDARHAVPAETDQAAPV